MTQTALFNRTPSRRLATLGKTFNLTGLLELWRSRQALRRLDAQALKDIGLSAHDASIEANRPVWDVPQNWRM